MVLDKLINMSQHYITLYACKMYIPDTKNFFKPIWKWLSNLIIIRSVTLKVLSVELTQILLKYMWFRFCV